MFYKLAASKCQGQTFACACLYIQRERPPPAHLVCPCVHRHAQRCEVRPGNGLWLTLRRTHTQPNPPSRHMVQASHSIQPLQTPDTKNSKQTRHGLLSCMA